MGTLEELKRENERLKNIQSGIRDMQKIQAERIRLMKENKRLARGIKYGKVINTGKRCGSTGVKIFKTLQKWGANLEEAEKRQKRLNKSLKSKSRVNKVKKRK